MYVKTKVMQKGEGQRKDGGRKKEKQWQFDGQSILMPKFIKALIKELYPKQDFL